MCERYARKPDSGDCLYNRIGIFFIIKYRRAMPYFVPGFDFNSVGYITCSVKYELELALK